MGDLFSSPKHSQPDPSPAPSVAASASTSKSPEELRRAGRASLLINTSSQGVLGNPTTGRKSLLSAT